MLPLLLLGENCFSTVGRSLGPVGGEVGSSLPKLRGFFVNLDGFLGGGGIAPQASSPQCRGSRGRRVPLRGVGSACDSDRH